MKIGGLAMKTAAPNSLLAIRDMNVHASPGHSQIRWVSITRTRVLKCEPLQSGERDVDFWKETKQNKHWHFTAPAAICTVSSSLRLDVDCKMSGI